MLYFAYPGFILKEFIVQNQEEATICSSNFPARSDHRIRAEGQIRTFLSMS